MELTRRQQAFFNDLVAFVIDHPELGQEGKRLKDSYLQSLVPIANPNKGPKKKVNDPPGQTVIEVPPSNDSVNEVTEKFNEGEKGKKSAKPQKSGDKAVA